MFGVASQGGSVDRLAGGFPLHSILCGIAFGCALWWSPVVARTLYQCTGSSGEAVFSSSKVGYQSCKAIGGYAAPAPRHHAMPPRAALNRVAGTVQTTADSLQAPAAAAASLAGVRGTVETSARRLVAEPQGRASLAAVRGSVVTGSAALPSATETSAAAEPAWAARKAGVSATRSVGRTYYYKVVHADGSMYLGDHSPQLQKGDMLTKTFVEYITTCAACDLHSPIHWNSTRLNLIAYADTIRAASVEYSVDEAFLRAIIHAESAFNPRALSLKGAQGLMQLMPGTASDMGVLDAFDSDQNIRGGARYLGLLLRNFGGNERLAAAAYNAGPGAVQRYKGVPPYAETQVYVERVDTLRKRYGAAIHPPLAVARGPG